MILIRKLRKPFLNVKQSIYIKYMSCLFKCLTYNGLDCRFI